MKVQDLEVLVFFSCVVWAVTREWLVWLLMFEESCAADRLCIRWTRKLYARRR